MIQAIRKRRGDKRKECLEEFQRAQKLGADLETALDQAESKVEQLLKDIAHFQNNHDYKDCERSKDLKEKLKDRLGEEQKTLKDLSQQKEEA